MKLSTRNYRGTGFVLGVGILTSAVAGFAPSLESRLVKPLGHSYQYFGNQVAVAGEFAAVGAPGERLDPDDATSPVVGAVHVYRREPEGWRWLSRLVTPGEAGRSEFGYSVAMSGETLVVGAYLDSAVAPYSGAVHVYTLRGGQWEWTQTLRPAVVTPDQTFGATVALSGDLLVAGAGGEFGVVDDQSPYGGAAYVFRRQAEGWMQEARLLSPMPDPDEAFGWWLDVDGSTVAVGAPYAAVAGEGVTFEFAGAVYVYESSAEGWQNTWTLASRDPGAYANFGLAVTISGNTLAVGTPWSGAQGGGAVEVFRREGTSWGWEVSIAPDDSRGNEEFGYAVDLSGEDLVAGAPGDTLVAGVESAGGSVYVFERQDSGWSFSCEVGGVGLIGGARLGHSVAFDGQSLAVGAPGDISEDDSADSVWLGSATIFEQSADTGNQPPVADVSLTERYVISPGKQPVQVWLDGSLSVDPDGDALSYLWVVGDRVVGSEPRTMVALAPGEHEVRLVVSDGGETVEAQMVVRVVPASLAVKQLLRKVKAARLSKGYRRLGMALLGTAAHAFERGRVNLGLCELVVFQIWMGESRCDRQAAAPLIEEARWIAKAICDRR